MSVSVLVQQNTPGLPAETQALPAGVVPLDSNTVPATFAFCKVMLTGPELGLPLTEVTTPPETTTVMEVGASVLSPVGGLAEMFQVPSARWTP